MSKKKAKTGKTCHGVSAKSLNTWAKQVCALIYTFWVIPRLQGGGDLTGIREKKWQGPGVSLKSKHFKLHKSA